MNLADIQPAVAQVAAQPLVTDLRGHTYLATYPAMIAIGAAAGITTSVKFHQLATLVYGWMPKIVRINPTHSTKAIVAFDAAISATPATFADVSVKDISDCLHSVVGASKLLHFANPDVFPIWDSNVEIFRAKPDSDITSVPQYFSYVKEVHNIRAEISFSSFYTAFNIAYSARLKANGIPAYTVGEVRAIEAAAFELARA